MPTAYTVCATAVLLAGALKYAQDSARMNDKGKRIALFTAALGAIALIIDVAISLLK